jgi:hypothetical protein
VAQTKEVATLAQTQVVVVVVPHGRMQLVVMVVQE